MEETAARRLHCKSAEECWHSTREIIMCIKYRDHQLESVDGVQLSDVTGASASPHATGAPASPPTFMSPKVQQELEKHRRDILPMWWGPAPGTSEFQDFGKVR
jgi:hypothetical protein